MAQNLLQEHLYGDLLAPTQGYHTDFAMGMTYSLGFDALMTAQLAFGMLGDMNEKDIQTPHLLFEAILKNSDKMVIFCNKGSIAVPPTIRKVYSLLEKNIFEVFNPENNKANFHPKLWLIREVNDDNTKDVLIKLIVSSRNMAYSDNIDCIACLTGKIGSAQTKNEKHTRLRTFVEKVLAYSNISKDRAQLVKSLAKDVERVERFDVCAPFEDYDFYPYLFKEDFKLGKIKDYLCGTESIIVSPFIDISFIENNLLNNHCSLITRKEFVTKALFNMITPKGNIYITIDDLASRGMDVHAKMYLIWMGRDKHYLYLGSANATSKAFNENGEFLLQLKLIYGNSKYNYFLKDFYEEGNKESKFCPLNEPTERLSADVVWDKAEIAMKDMMCAKDLMAKITKHRDSSYSVVVTSSMKKTEIPVYIAPLQKKDMELEWKGRANFDGLTIEELSEFYIVWSKSEEGKRHESVIRIATEGMPTDRDTAIYKSIIKNKHDFVKFLELMLSDTPVKQITSELSQKEMRGEASDDENYEFSQIYEKMLKVAAVNPNQISQIGKIMSKLDNDTVPNEFSIIYQKISNALN